MTDAPNTLIEKQQAWYKAVAGVFARVQKKDVADIPLDIWQKLIKTTYDGIPINPLYNRADELDEAALPGVFPYRRGAAGVGQENQGWGVAESFDEKSTNQQVLDSLYNGTTNLVIQGSADIATLLSGVYLSLCPVRLFAGVRTVEQAKALFAVADSQQAAQRDNTRAILVDAVTFSNQGATDAEEIGLALAAGVEYLRALTDAGFTVEQALDQISFRFATTDEQFAQIAKFRAARQLWARVAEIVGAPEHGTCPQHALTAPVMFTQRDPWVNMLRSTVAAFAAGVGGATDVEVLPFDWAIPGGLPKTSRSFARRIARNTNLLLLEESHLSHVIDPGGGSYFIEAFTTQLADKAWEVFTSVEAEGGLQQAIAAGTVAKLLDDAHEAQRKDIARRIKKITAINEFPNLAEAPLPADLRVEPSRVRRWAAEFEALRNRSDAYMEVRGTRPTAVLIPLGPLAKHNIRTGFATNLLASGGIEALNPGQVTPGTEEFTTAAKSAPIAVICGTDQEYDATGKDAYEALRAAGVDTILLAGSPGHEFEPDGYLNMKIDAAATLAELLTKLGA